MEWKALFEKYHAIFAPIISGIVLALVVFGGKQFLRWVRERTQIRRERLNTGIGQSKLLLLAAIRGDGLARRREPKDRFSPPYYAPKVLAGDGTFQEWELDYLVWAGAFELKNSSEVTEGSVCMEERLYALTKKGRKWGRILLRQEERELKALRPGP